MMFPNPKDNNGRTSDHTSINILTLGNISRNTVLIKIVRRSLGQAQEVEGLYKAIVESAVQLTVLVALYASIFIQKRKEEPRDGKQRKDIR